MPFRPDRPTSDKTAASLLYVVTEDWFFVSHFLPMARAAQANGFRVAIATRVRDHGDRLAQEGFRVIPIEAERGSLSPIALLRAIGRLATILRAERPDIVHLIALRSILVGGPAARRAGLGRRVVALTGLGFLGAMTGLAGVAGRIAARLMVRGLAGGARTRYLFENRDDPRSLGLDPDQTTRCLVVGGAGVDPHAFPAHPLPEGATLRVALVARMLWSKGIDLAVEAVAQARAAGVDVTLSLFGAPDPSNPRAVPEATLRAWGKREGIVWHGPTRDVAGVWATHHVALLPSRGGEGLPRTLLEAGCCGRALIATDVPGCRDFIQVGETGFVVAPGDVAALGSALSVLAADRTLVERMGKAARQRVLAHHTEAAVGAAVVGLYRAMLGDRDEAA